MLQTCYDPKDPTIVRRLGAAVTSDVTVTASVVNTTETALDTREVPANFWAVGKTIRFEALGWSSRNGIGEPTITFTIRLGGIAGDVLGAITLAGSTARTTTIWRISGLITCRSVGASGTVFPQFEILESLVTTAVPMNAMPKTGSAPTATIAAVTTDTTAAKDLVLSVTFSGNTAGNFVTLGNCVVTEVS